MNSLPRNCTLARAKLHDAITTTHRFANDLTQQRLEEGALPPPHPPQKKRREEAGARRRGSATQLRDRVADSLANELDVRIRERGPLGGEGGGPVSCELGAARGALQATLGRRSSAVHEQHNGGQNGATAILMTQCCSDEKWLG